MTAPPLTPRAVAAAALAAGISTVPPAEDGTKRPLTEWKLFQQQLPSAGKVTAWYADHAHTGVGVVCGKVSGNLECFEFDDRETYERFLAAAEACGLGELVGRIRSGYEEATPGGGIHWLYKSPQIAGNTKLARRPSDDQTVTVLIETRGEGGYAVVAPSNGRVHPTGNPYRLLLGGVDTITTITPDEREALHDLARSFDKMPRPPAAEPTPPRPATSVTRPGDDFNARASWDTDILRPHGWHRVFERNGETFWRRPGKNLGVSATTNYAGSDLIFVFSTSTPFESERGYTKFGAYALLEHDGDVKAAARALAAQGYGEQQADKETGRGEAGAEEAKPNVAGKGEAEARLDVRQMSTVTYKAVEWIWPRWLARGKLHILGGLGGVGKGTIMAALAAQLSTGKGVLPDRIPAPLVKSLFLLSEDAADDTFWPRLDIHEANKENVSYVEAVIYPDDKSGMLNLSKHVSLLEQAVKTYDIGLVVIDALSDFMAGADRNSEGEVRDVLTPLSQMAQRTGVAIVGVMHPGKGNADLKGFQRILGSSAFGNVARCVWLVGESPDGDGRKLLGVDKSNLSMKPETLAWSRPEDAAIVWHGSSNHSLDDVFGGSTAKPRDDAEGFLNELLQDGPIEASKVEALAKAAGLSWATVRRAADELKIKKYRPEGQKNPPWVWALPSTPTDNDPSPDDPPPKQERLEQMDELLTPSITPVSNTSSRHHHVRVVHDDDGWTSREKPHESGKMLTNATGEQLVPGPDVRLAVDDRDGCDDHKSYTQSEDTPSEVEKPHESGKMLTHSTSEQVVADGRLDELLTRETQGVSNSSICSNRERAEHVDTSSDDPLPVECFGPIACGRLGPCARHRQGLPCAANGGE